MLIAQVALNTPALDFFDYTHPQPLSVGVRVVVPFGKRTLTGIVVGITKDSTTPTHKLKPIQAVLGEPILPSQTLKLARWLSQYYHYPLGETLAVMLPTQFRQGKTIAETIYWDKSQNAHTSSDMLNKDKKLQSNLAYFLSHKLPIDQKQLKLSSKALQFLQEAGLIERSAAPPKTLAHACQPHLTPTDCQKQAVCAISQAINQGDYQAFLLDGATGSGKTEVYLQAIDHALQKGKQVLVLVPEIGLTPQTQERFFERFCANILVLHSAQNDTQRHQGFLACLSGEADIVIATRSACFYPFANLGLIVIDEAHDGSYKQTDHLRYHACDVAMMVAFWQRIPIVLGSATPSLEQLRLCQMGKLTKLSLNAAQNLNYLIVDNRTQHHPIPHQSPNESSSTLAPKTVMLMREHLAADGQVLVFLNRRGYAPVLLCQACGYQADCIRCSAHLTVHKGNYSRLKCHHCHYQAPMPTHCPSCNSPNLTTLGQGTSQLHEHLHALFADPQTTMQPYEVLQIDKDTTRSKKDWERLYHTIGLGKPMILVGTQMIAKGHHFPKVSLVVVVDADAGFLSADFHSPEETCQRIIQVAGRTGRTQKTGTVVIQTLKPDNPLLITLIKHGYAHAAECLLKERRLLGLPPFSHAAVISAHSTNLELAKEAIVYAKNHLPACPSLSVLAPLPSPIAKKNHQYGMQMVLKATQRKQLHEAVDKIWVPLKERYRSRHIRLSLDIDPKGW